VTSQPKPALQRVFEAAASVLNLDEGNQRLELIFRDGHLVRSYHHRGPIANDELARYEAHASWLAEATDRHGSV
jgi:hypothetical protein